MAKIPRSFIALHGLYIGKPPWHLGYVYTMKPPKYFPSTTQQNHRTP